MNTCQHTAYSTTWRDCDLHPEVECFATTCDNCNTITSRDCEENLDWHTAGHENCHHPWYSTPHLKDRFEDEYAAEFNWLDSLAPDTITQCLNGEPVTAEDRLETIRQIALVWHTEVEL